MTSLPGLRVDMAGVETNIVNVDVDVDAEGVAREAKARGLLVHASAARRLRFVTHLDVSSQDVETAVRNPGRRLGRRSVPAALFLFLFFFFVVFVVVVFVVVLVVRRFALAFLFFGFGGAALLELRSTPTSPSCVSRRLEELVGVVARPLVEEVGQELEEVSRRRDGARSLRPAPR